MSRTLPALLLLTSLASLPLARSDTETYGHEYFKSNTSVVGMHAVETLTPRSLLDCSSLCLNRHWSAYYTYNKLTDTCVCGNRVSVLHSPINSATSQDQLYIHRMSSQCPVDTPVNYNVYVYRDTVLCLRFGQQSAKYQAAADDCAATSNLVTSMPGRLVKSDTGDKLEILVRADDVEGTLSTNNVWIGMQDISTENSFFWSDGEAATQAQITELFSPGQPSDTGPQQEDCVNFLRRDHKLNDAYCGHAYPYICEIPLNPDA